MSFFATISLDGKAVAETATHWITVGVDKDLDAAMRLAARNAIEFLSTAPS